MRERVVFNDLARCALLGAVRAALPHEACGALLGRCDYEEWWEVERVQILANAAADPSREFLITGDSVRALERMAAEQNTQVIGFYHSHPAGTTPSKRDLAAAFPGYLYVIADASRDGVLSAYKLADDRAAFITVKVEP